MNLKKKLLTAALAVSFAVGSIAVSQAAPLSRKPQDNLFYATSTEPQALDPALIEDGDSATVVCNIYESLLKFEDNGTNVKPSLAEKWDISKDGKVYTFYLRKGVKFHDGTPFNAEAVKFNFDRQNEANRAPKMSYAGLVFGDVASTDVVDEYTVRVTLKKSSTPFIRNMAMALGAPIASPTAIKKYNNNISEHPCGTGPYKFVAWDRGQQIILTTNEDYWGEKPKVQNVVLRVMKETSARVVALNNGEVDIVNGIDANVVEEIKKGNNELFNEVGNNVNYMIFNCRKGYVTEDPAVRKAIAQSINIPELVDSLYKEYSEPATSFFPSFMAGYDKNLKPIAYDPKAAQKTFADKGIKELKIVTYSNARYYNTAGGQVLAEAVQDYLSKVGVKAVIEVYDWATFRSKLATDKWDISFIGWIGDNGDPDNFINLLAANDPNINQGLWLNKEFISIINEATHVPDGEERAELYKQAERILVKDVGVFPISHAKTLLANRKGVKNAVVHPVGLIFFDKIEK